MLPPKDIPAFEDELKRSGNKTAAQFVHSRVLLIQLAGAKDDPAAFRKRLDEVKKFLDTPPLAPGCVELAEQPAELVEQTGDAKLAVEAYESLPTASPSCRGWPTWSSRCRGVSAASNSSAMKCSWKERPSKEKLSA